VVQELFSPIVTPFLLCFNLRFKSLDIVDFFRNFTVDVVGVGDVCSFAQMDVKRHGNPEVSCRHEIVYERFLNLAVAARINFSHSILSCFSRVQEYLLIGHIRILGIGLELACKGGSCRGNIIKQR